MRSPNRHPGHCTVPALTLIGLATLTACTTPAVNTTQSARFPGDAAHRTATLVSHEVQVNSFTSSTQAHAAIAMHPDGTIVVVWDSRRQQRGTYGIYLQRFDATGAPIGGETQVNLETASMQMQPAVAVDGRGGTWVAWQSFGQDGSMAAIVARRFDAEFAGSDEILVNQERGGMQGDVVVAADSAGNASFFWTTPNRSGNARIVAGRRFDAAGSALGDEFAVAGTDAAWQNLPAVAVDARDRVIVAWAEADERGVPGAIRTRVLDADGTMLTPALTVSDVGLPVEPAVAAADDGSFVVAWMTAAGEDYAVARRRFDARGRALEPTRLVARPGTHKYFSGVAAAMAADGAHALAWNAREVDVYHDDVYVQRFDAAGAAIGAPERVNRHRDDSQRLDIASGKRRLELGADGRIAAAWAGETAQGDPTAVGLTVLAPAGAAFALEAPSAGPAPKDVAQTAQPYEPPTFDPKRVSHDPFGGDLHPFAADGGDFGFIGVVNSGWTPPDPHIACGPHHVVLMTNGEISFFAKDGTNTFRDEIENSFGFWGGLGADNFVFDPEVLFDPHSQRFMAMACERSDNGRSNFLLAVSDDDDPNGDWFKYRLDVTALAGNDIDSPNIGVDAETVYLSSDHFGPDKYLIYMVRKSDVLVGNAPLTRSLLVTGEQSMGLPVNYDADAPAQYLIRAFEFGAYTQVQLHAITDPLGTPQRVTTLLTVPSYSHPEDPPQMGTSSRPELFEARFWNCVYRNGSLWAVHHEGGSRVRARWYEIAMNGWPGADGAEPELVQTGLIDGGAGVRTFFPSIWVDDAGNAAITTARSSSQEFISMSRAVRRASDPPGEFRPIEFVRESSGSYVSGRWGDYSNTVSDPADPGVFWGHHEYTPGGNSWNTWVAKYVVGVPCPGDANADGVVSFTDIVAVLSAWGPCGGCPEDFDNSGTVDFSDLLAVLKGWGDCP